MHLAKVKRSEIRKKRLIHQVIIDTEVERVLARLWWILVANPIETTWDNLDWLICVTFSRSRGSSFRIGLYHFFCKDFQKGAEICEPKFLVLVKIILLK